MPRPASKTMIHLRPHHLMQLLLAACLGSQSPAQPSPNVPGAIISYSIPSSNKYIGSPGLAKLPDGTLVASHDEFGGGSSQTTSGITRIYRSTDRGLTWSPAAVINGAFWSSLFVHNGALYLLGCTHQYGNAVIRRSLDGGITWTTPTSPTTGLLASDGNYHCAPMPVLIHNGRLWRAMERRVPGTGWGVNFRAGVMSIPTNADLLDASQWTFSNLLPSDTAWLGGKFGGWLEGNIVSTPSGNLANILRVDHPDHPEKAAVVNVSNNGTTLTFNPATGFINLPGGSKKFAIRHDTVSNRYWTIANLVPPAFQTGRHPASTRNTLNLLSSHDLSDWTDEGLILSHQDVTRHGFQYVEWLFDGDDIIATSRTGFDDLSGGAANYHDANYLTFHRLENFRTFSTNPLPGPWKQAFFATHDVQPNDDADGDGFSNRHEFLAGSNPRRPNSTTANARATAKVAIAGAAGIDEYRVSASGTWTLLRQLSPTSYQSLIHHNGSLYGSGFSRIDRIDPATGNTTTLATRNTGTALSAAWTTADSQQIALGPDGKLYFSTAFGASAGQGVFRLNTDGSGFERFINRTGGSAPNNWELNNARGLSWLGNRLFASSRAGFSGTSRPVYEFTNTGAFTRTLRSDLRAPQGLMTDGETLLVAGVPGTLTGINATTANLSHLVSGLPEMACMAAAEIHGEIHIITYQHGVWRHRDSSALTRTFTPSNNLNASIVTIPETDPYDQWISGYPEINAPSPNADADGDGTPNRLEFLLDHDPLDGIPKFLTHIENNLLIFPSAPDQAFTIRSSPDLIDWSSIEAVVFGETGTDRATFPLPAVTTPSRFYKVEWHP